MRGAGVETTKLLCDRRKFALRRFVFALSKEKCAYTHRKAARTEEIARTILKYSPLKKLRLRTVMSKTSNYMLLPDRLLLHVGIVMAAVFTPRFQVCCRYDVFNRFEKAKMLA